MTRAEELFSKKDIKANAREDYIQAIERKMGQLAIENDFLKKNLIEYPKRNELK